MAERATFTDDELRILARAKLGVGDIAAELLDYRATVREWAGAGREIDGVVQVRASVAEILDEWTAQQSTQRAYNEAAERFATACATLRALALPAAAPRDGGGGQ